jgi:hypothetical protein
MNNSVKKEADYKTTRSWNPFVGCNFKCVYCRPSFQNLIAWLGRMHDCDLCQKYGPHEHPQRLTRIPSDKAIFVCEDGDIALATPNFMEKVFAAMRADKKEDRVWFVQSKNPRCLGQYLGMLPENTFLLTTLETNRDERYDKISGAPKPSVRYRDFLGLKWDRKMVTVEPILDFDLPIFTEWIESINPQAVFVGYNSHTEAVSLPEPEKKKTWQLIHELERKGIQVLKKEMRDKRVRKKAYRDFLQA